ncbi:hypothetical protein [Pikeienuella sp. HZG-20]|uniref:hypothetical protein n=1 Tax=Paludibacillus litoralis TaxID=3133267 RepID=UPI0030EF930E
MTIKRAYWTSFRLASGQIGMRKNDGWKTLLSPSIQWRSTSPPDRGQFQMTGVRRQGISTIFETQSSELWRLFVADVDQPEEQVGAARGIGR